MWYEAKKFRTEFISAFDGIFNTYEHFFIVIILSKYTIIFSLSHDKYYENIYYFTLRGVSSVTVKVTIRSYLCYHEIFRFQTKTLFVVNIFWQAEHRKRSKST